MNNFSIRNGYYQPALQIEFIDEKLKNRLWDVIYRTILYYQSNEWEKLLLYCWTNFFGERNPSLPGSAFADKTVPLLKIIEKKYYSLAWCEIYDFLEFLINYMPNNFQSSCNQILEEENSAYRFVNSLIMPITTEIEIKNIETASSTPYQCANKHIQKACKLLSDRQNPDYANSVKESISAIEGLLRELFSMTSESLGDILKKKEKELGLDTNLHKAIEKIYAYRGNASAVGHSIKPGSQPSQPDRADANFLLVMCSAFINFIIEKQN